MRLPWIEGLPPSIAREASTIRADWLDLVPVRERTNGGQTRKDGHHNTYGTIATHLDESPYHRTREEIENTISRAQSLGEELWKRTRELIRSHWNHASRSGDSYFAVRTTHNLCNRLLQIGPSESYLAQIQVWTLQAIEADSDNAYIWDLWAKVLSALGHNDASLSVRWESIRRFPDNCVLRNSLAEALMEQHKDVIAESLLRQTMQDFPSDVFARHILVKMLRRHGRQEEAQQEFLSLKTLAPENYYVQSLAGVMVTVPTENARTAWIGRSEDRDTEFDADAQEPTEPARAEGQESGPEGVEVESEISAYLDRLAEQVAVLECYFAPLERRSGNGTTPGAQRPDEISSEFELVAAHRAGFVEGPERREFLETWASARPSSYSVRLLLAWQGAEGNGLDRMAMSSVATDFPERRHWNDWLCYGFIPEEERSRLRQEAKDSKHEPEAAFWGGRLSAVYPDLETEEVENGSAVRYDPAALRRLLEDVAFAGAERALPSASIFS